MKLFNSKLNAYLFTLNSKIIFVIKLVTNKTKIILL